MEKKKKRIIIGITAAAVAAAAVAVALVLYFAKGYEIRFEETFAEDLTFEYGQEADIPKAYVVNKHGIRQFGRVAYLFTSAEGTETKTNYPVAKCDSVGDWTVTCSYENAEIQKHFRVVDTVAPEIIVGALPSDVFVGNTDVEYTVPGFDIKDSSPIDYDNCSATLYFEGEQVKYNTLTNAFVPERDGEYVFKLKAADIYGNTSEKECRWRAKDAGWTDQNLPDGYLATFDSIGYANLISSGFINGYWDGTEVEEFLEEYEGEKGVLKVSAAYNVLGLTAFKVKLAKAITPKQLGDNVVIIRYRVDSKNTNGILTVAGNYQETIQSAAAKSAVFVPGEWQTVTLTAEDLTKYAYTDEDGVFRSLQLGLSRNGSGSSVDVYLASITIGRKLEAPKNLGLSGGSLKWDPVKGATGYYLFADGEETELGADITSCSLGKHKIFKVRAKGDGLFTVDSDESIYVNDMPAEGYLAEFDEAYYQYLVWNNGARAEGGMEWYESDSFEAAYDDKEKALRLDLTQGYVAAGVVVRLPKAAETDSLDRVVIRFKSDGNVKCVRAYQYGGPALLLETTDIKEGWNSLVISRSTLAGDASNTGSFSGFQLMFYANEKPTNGKGQGTKMTVYLGTVTRAVQLDAPTNLKLSGNKLTWEAVANAKGYVVEEDGKKHSVNDTSYTIKGGELFQVYAAGDNKFYVDSEKTILVNGSVAEGYLASFDRPYYEYLIWNNGANAPGGMQWYESDSHKVTYEIGTGTVRVDMTMGYVCAGSVIKFPKAAKLSGVDDLIVRVKLDGAVKTVAFYQYGGSGLIYKTTAVTTGWNDIIIPKKALLADAGSKDTMSGIQLILYGNEQGENGLNQGTATTMYLDYIASIRRLDAPANVKVEGNVLTWDAVDGAVKYLVYEDEATYTVASNSHTLHGGELLKVQALGDGRTTLDSELTICINARVSEGYLAEFNKEYYNYLIWNNGADAPGGMQWYDFATFAANYDAANEEMDVTARYGAVCSGMVVKFPQGKALEAGKDLVLNIKLDDTVKALKLYPYGLEGTIYATRDLKVGWNRIIVPAGKVAAAVGSNTFEGLQIVLYDNAEYGPTAHVPAKTANINLGKIHYAKALDKPVLTVEDTTVNWTAVEHADSYDVYVNDEWKRNQTSTSYSIAGLANGIYSIKVVAKSDKEIYLDAASDAVKYSNLEILNVPVLTYHDGTVSFTSVSGAAGYKIEIDGTEYDIDKSAVSVKPAELIGKQILVKYRMKAVGDNQTTADSEWSDYQIQDLLLEKDYIADFDEGYTVLVWNNGANAEGGQQWYESDSFKASYDSEEEGIRLALKHGYVCAGFILRFPQTVQKSEIDNLVLRIKLDENVKKLQVFEYNGTGVMMEFKDLKAGWNELIIPRANLKNDPGKDYISGLQIAMYTSNNSVLGDSQGRDITAVLGSVRNMKNTEPEYKDITITGIDGNTNATAIYLNLSAGTGVGTWASFASDSALTTEGILYNGVKLAVNAQTTWVENMFCIQPGRTPVAGDILKITGTFKCGDVGIKVAEYALQYTGTTWVVYEEGDYDLIRITGVESAYTNASAIYLNLSAGTGVSAWASFASDSTLETEGILYNGVKLAINAQTTWAANMFCIQPGRTPVTGDKIKIAGTFKCGDVGIRVAEYVLQYNGTTWVAYEGAETSSQLMIQGGLGAAIRSRVLRDGKEHL